MLLRCTHTSRHPLCRTIHERNAPIPYHDELLQLDQRTNFTREILEHIERYIKVRQPTLNISIQPLYFEEENAPGKLAHNTRQRAKLIITNIKLRERLQAGEVPRQAFHPVILRCENHRLSAPSPSVH